MKTTKRRLKAVQPYPEMMPDEDRLFRYFISYMLLLLFVVVGVFSTSDLQLLQMQQGIVLPLINVSTSIQGFYVFSTMIVFVTSIFMSREFYIFEKLRQQTKQYPSTLSTHSDYSNQINNLFGVNGKFDSILFSAMSRLVFFISGPSTIALLLFRFADSQDRIIFGVQLILFSISVYFSWVFCERTMQLHKYKKQKFWRVIITIAVLCVLLEILICIDVIYLPPQHSMTFFIKSHTLLLDDKDGGTIFMVPHIKIDRSDSIWNAETARQKFENFVSYHGEHDSNHYFMSRGLSVDLRGRQLRFLNINFQIAPRIWAHEADLSGANLSFTNLAGSNFIDTNLYAANMDMANLDGSRFFNVNFDNSSWSNTRARGAIFDNVHFRFAKLKDTKFTGSSFLGSEIIESRIVYVNFDATSFYEMVLKNNTIIFNSKAKIFCFDKNNNNIDSSHSDFFDINDSDAISKLVREFCVAKLHFADLSALYTLANAYMLAYPERIRQIDSAFEESNCNTAKLAWLKNRVLKDEND
jgi:uncharacterized protein YjbI with pentapeptide repeats